MRLEARSVAARLRGAAPATVTIGVFAVMAAATWNTWADPLVDFGRELYLAWRLSEGAVLYRDVAHLNGPLSAYANAALFAVFGTSTRTLEVANLCVLAGIAGLIYRLLLILSDRLTSTVGVGVFLAVFGFGALRSTGNYNFVCPYSHELTHGLLLALLSVWAMARWIMRAQGGGWALAAGFCAGLAFLTKPETGFAAFVGVAGMLTLAACSRLPSASSRRALLSAMLGASVGPILACSMLAGPLGLGGAARALSGPWRAVFDARIRMLHFYQASAGLDEPLRRVVTLGQWCAVYLLTALGIGVVAWLLRPEKRHRQPIPPWLVAALVLAVALPHVDWEHSLAPLPLVALAALVSGVREVLRNRLQRGLVLVGLGGLSLALLTKILLASRPSHYGFALAVPATMLAIVFLLHSLPVLIRSRGGSWSVARSLGAVLVLGWSGFHVTATVTRSLSKTEQLGTGADLFLGDPRSAILQRSARYLDKRLQPSERVVALPEGIILNYLLRRRSSVACMSFMPPELIAFGEQRVLARLEETPPDAVVIVHKDTSEYGFPLFGRDYGVGIMAWVRQHYVREALIGDEPLTPRSRFGVEIMRPRAAIGRQTARPARVP